MGKGESAKELIDEERIKEIESFLKEAFCIDGECKFKQIDHLLNSDEGSFLKKVMTFELTDSRRGRFLISMSKNLEDSENQPNIK